MPETEAQRCLRIGNRLADEGKHDQAAQWRALALQTAKGLDKTYDFFRLSGG